MIEFFGCSRHHMKMELARHGINLKHRTCSIRRTVRKPKLYNPWSEDEDDLPDDFDPDDIPIERISVCQLTQLERAILILGDRVRTTPDGYFLDRTPVSVQRLLKEAGLDQ
ncbi:hypothetical protein [Candidatus Macondimonas diazotrophica]|uniref:Uncharacterized protein n=1 Tax=Candidatus Macondimonas diazotrophica TaxID=2305248 RepID=A0A4Z0F7H2_9GAMM|nr:hypothetical protein [Candidatus Macondimonas diazotrophica]TFZ81649.1 hypothetical protein E4680_11745 [Candidatus Macondimonas diazotrophica]